MKKWETDIDKFIEFSNKYGVKMLMVGGGAVNFHGYQRHSADVDFWIDTTKKNLKGLISVFNDMGYDISSFPEKVIRGEQNVSVKFSPEELDLELITNFDVNKSFEEAYQESISASVKGNKFLKWRVLSLDDLIISKIKAGRPKDLLDVQQLNIINGLDLKNNEPK